MDQPTNTKRVELDNGAWALVRRITPGDIRAARLHVHDRGWEDPELDSLFLLPRVIVEWSYGDVTPDAIDANLNEVEYLRIWATCKGADLPNPSSLSSNGSGRKARSARPQKGQSSG